MKQYGKKNRETNAEELSTKSRRYYQQNKARIRRQHQAYHRANKEQASRQKRLTVQQTRKGSTSEE
jgi:hypothetical protein